MIFRKTVPPMGSEPRHEFRIMLKAETRFRRLA